MTPEELIRQLMATFLDELEEHVQALNRDLLALEQVSDAERPGLLTTLFRTVHSLKGAARAVNITPIETLCHQLESFLADVRQTGASLPPRVLQLFFEAADAFRDAGNQLRAGVQLDEAPLSALLRELEAAVIAGAALPPAALPEAPPPALPPAPIPAAVGSAGPGQEPREVHAGRGAPRPPSASAEGAAPAETPRPASPVLWIEDGAGSASRDLERSPEVSPAPSPPARVTAAATLERAPGDQGPAPAPPSRRARPMEGASVRVPAEKLDSLLLSLGELSLATRGFDALQSAIDELETEVAGWMRLGAGDGRQPRASDGLARLARSLEQLSTSCSTRQRLLDQSVRAVEDDVHRLRLLPFAHATQGFDRAVRDIARDSNKDVELSVEADVELDRSILEALRNPLLHLVRNAVEHGVEPIPVRVAAGKSARARIGVSAALRGTQVEVTVADDGRGVDVEAVRAQARRRGLVVPEDEHELFQLLFLPGFSTARIVTELSGRGVGLDVVKSQVESLHGGLQLFSVAGRGARFVITVPLTLTTIRVLMVGVAGHVVAIPTTTVRGLIRVSADDLRRFQGRETLVFAGETVPVTSLAVTLGVRAQEPPIDVRMPAVVVAPEGAPVALLVDELVAEHDITVKNLGRRVRRARHVSGATILPNGRIAFVLHMPEVARTALRQGEVVTRGRGGEQKKRILVAEDSLTTRTLEKTILEGAGYQVRTAADGAEAWHILNEEGADLVLSDVEMPRMDGFTLATNIRSSRRFRELPVILLTGLANEQDRKHGIEVGADAYLVKTVFDHTMLLDVIKQLI